MTSKSIYIASKTKHADKWRKLRADGWNIISTWIDEAGQGQTKNRRDLAQRCIREAASADLFILYVEPGEQLKGALIEAGAALHSGVCVLCVGSIESVFESYNWWYFKSLSSLLAYLETKYA